MKGERRTKKMISGVEHTIVEVSLADLCNTPETITDVQNEVRSLKEAVAMFSRFVEMLADKLTRPSDMPEYVADLKRSKLDLVRAERKLERMRARRERRV